MDQGNRKRKKVYKKRKLPHLTEQSRLVLPVQLSKYIIKENIKNGNI